MNGMRLRRADLIFAGSGGGVAAAPAAGARLHRPQADQGPRGQGDQDHSIHIHPFSPVLNLVILEV
jgi:hypothetical protein